MGSKTRGHNLLVHQFFYKLYTKQQEAVNFDHLLQNVNIPRITLEQAIELNKPFAVFDIEKALFSIPPDNVAGPDRMIALFFFNIPGMI